MGLSRVGYFRCNFSSNPIQTNPIMGNKNGRPVLRDQDVANFIKTSGLDEVQVREAFKCFMNDHPKGTMKHADFNEMIKRALPSVDATKLAKHVFRVYDTNNDGVIDFIEFMVIYHVMSDGTPEEVLQKIFKVFDANLDGTINKTEMGRLVKDIYSLIKHDDPEAASMEAIASSAFIEMDKDVDGKITVEEFTRACLEREQISKMLALKFINVFVEDGNE